MVFARTHYTICAEIVCCKPAARPSCGKAPLNVVMPLTPIYTWTETETNVQITIDNVPIKDQSQLFCSDRVVKLNAPPYFLLLDLWAAVDDDRSTATVVHGRKILFQLIKTEPGLWGSLTAEGDKRSIKQQREESVQRAHEKLVTAQKQRLERKQKEEKAAIDLQIAQERAQRARIEQLKQQELQQEREQLQEWQQQQQSSKQQLPDAGDESDYEDDLQQDSALAGQADAAPAVCLQDNSMPGHPDYYGRGWRPNKSQPIAETAADIVAAGEHEAAQQVNNGSGSRAEAASDSEMITITAAPAAAADSKTSCMSAMHQMLADAGAAAALTGKAATTDSASSSSSTAPSRGEELLTAVHTSSTRASYGTSASDTKPPPPAAAAVAAVKQARQVSKPPAPVRFRAEPVTVTFTQLETAHLPAREQREVEFKHITRQTKAESLDVTERQPAFLKDKGDGLAAQGSYMGAINAYTQALQLDPKQASLWSNRAACHLAIGHVHECAQDCAAAVKLLQQTLLQLCRASGVPDVQQEITAGMLPPAAAAAAVAAAALTGSGGDRAVRASIDDAGPGSDMLPVDACECCSDSCSANSAAVAAADPAAVAAAHSATAPAAVESGAARKHALASPTQQQQQQPRLHGAGEIVPASSSAAVLKVQRQLAKVLGRRAAAYVELQQLQEAWDDMQHALRLDPGNAQLQADALEVSAALTPTAGRDPSMLKKRADARFKAGDAQGAIEAYTALIQLLWQQEQQQQQGATSECKQQQQQQQQEQEQQQRGANEMERQQKHSQQSQQLLVALSNRAACWLALEQYGKCVNDCAAGLRLVLGRPGQAASTETPVYEAAAAAGGEAATIEASSTAAAGGAAVRQDAAASQPALTAAAEAVTSLDATACNATEVMVVSQLLDLLKQHPVSLWQIHPEPSSTAVIRSAARLLSRMAVACGCLKQTQLAGQLYGLAQQCWLTVGDEQRAAAMAADQQRLMQLACAAESSAADSTVQDGQACGV